MRPTLLLALALAGCAHTSSREARYVSALKEWKGKDINLALEKMGPPSNVFQTPNGRTMYTWATSGPERRRGIYYAGAMTSYDTTSRCKITFTATPDGVIDRILSEGSCGVVPSR